jgi:hypothetical protein
MPPGRHFNGFPKSRSYLHSPNAILVDHLGIGARQSRDSSRTCDLLSCLRLRAGVLGIPAGQEFIALHCEFISTNAAHSSLSEVIDLRRSAGQPFGPICHSRTIRRKRKGSDRLPSDGAFTRHPRTARGWACAAAAHDNGSVLDHRDPAILGSTA